MTTPRQRLGWTALIVAAAQYLVVQVVVAAAWSDPPYDWNLNLISDLGNTACGPFTQGGITTPVCSPLHTTMNVAFTLNGVLTALGALALATWWPRRRLATTGTALLAVAGAQRALIGVYPENTVASLHALGALNLIPSAVAITLLSISVIDHRRWSAIGGLSLVGVSVVGVVVFVLLLRTGDQRLLDFEPGGAERLIAYPLNLWPLAILILSARSAKYPAARTTTSQRVQHC